MSKELRQARREFRDKVVEVTGLSSLFDGDGSAKALTIFVSYLTLYDDEPFIDYIEEFKSNLYETRDEIYNFVLDPLKEAITIMDSYPSSDREEEILIVKVDDTYWKFEIEFNSYESMIDPEDIISIKQVEPKMVEKLVYE